MKVYISFHFDPNSFGGGNNFLKYLKKYLKKKGNSIERVKTADVIIINSHHKVFYNLYLKFRFPSKLFIHRVDGRLSNHRKKMYWDELIKIQNKLSGSGRLWKV